MAKKRKAFMQNRIADLKRHNALLQSVCADWAKEYQALVRELAVKNGEILDLKRRNAELVERYEKEPVNGLDYGCHVPVFRPKY
jgi:hypothetical protein